MKTKIAMILILVLQGCGTVQISTTKPDGTTCTANGQVFMMSAQTLQSKACGGNLGATAPGVDAEAMAAVMTAAIAASVKAVKP